MEIKSNLGETVGILNIGSELLVGHTVNTHASYLSNVFNDFGYSVHYHLSVGDNPKRIKECLEYLADKCDIVVCTAGLGPTLDDITRDIVADFLGLQLVEDKETTKIIKDFFASHDIKYTENNNSQAFFPEGSTVLRNPMGTAPGFLVSKGDLTVICLPGPPKELYSVMENLRPLLYKGEEKLFNTFINIFGMGESECAEKIEDIFESQTDPSIGIYASSGMIKLRLSTMKNSQNQANSIIEPIKQQLVERLRDYVFSDKGEDLNERLLALLKEKGLKISFAESCTGGMAAKFLTDLSGSSEVFELGLVTYSNEQKVKRLGVSEEIIKTQGAVSEECVKAMNEGLYKLSTADICVSISGVAGPSESENKKAGTVCIGVLYRGDNIAKAYNFFGNRDRIRNYSMRMAYFNVIKILNEQK